MRRLSWVVPVLLVLSLLAGVRDARALPGNEVSDTFYNCALDQLGVRILFCTGYVYTAGQLSGSYRHRELTNCHTGAYSEQWYAWTGTEWIPIAPPQPNC